MSMTQRRDLSRLIAGGALGTSMYHVVDLSAHFNNDGISHAGNIPDGDLNGEGMAFPREVLPPSKQIVELCGVPTNVCLEGQVVDVPPGNYNRLHVLGVSEGGSFQERCGLFYASGVVAESRLGLTDCRPPWCEVKFGEQVALRFEEMHFPAGGHDRSSAGLLGGMWVQTLTVNRDQTLTAVELGDNPSMHVFAMTLEAPTRGVRGVGT